MIPIDPHKLETAFLRPDTLMLSDIIVRIGVDVALSADRRRDIVSGLRRVAKALGRPPEAVPADAHWLQLRLAQILPASIGITAKSWSNILSDARAGLAHCGVVQRRINRRADLSPKWKRLWQMVLASGDPTLPKSLPRFLYFLNHICIEPESVRLEHAEAFRVSIVQNELHRHPDHSFRTAVNSWNLAVKRFSEWPRQTFPLPSRAKIIKMKPEAFPLTFVADLEAYLTCLREPDPFSPDAVALPLRPATIIQYRAMLLRFASILVLAGIPVGEIDGLSDLVNIRNVEAGLKWMWAQNDKKTTVGTADTINLLRNLARRYVKVSDIDQLRLDQLNDRLAMKQQSGMTQKNRDRLRPLEDQPTLRRFLSLPQRMFERGIKGGDSLHAALMQEDAIAIAILLYCPIRAKNLVCIHLDRNLQRAGDGRVFLVFQADEVKNVRRIEFELPGEVVTMIDRYLTTRSPRLCPAGTPWLLSRRDGTNSASASYFSTKVKARIEKEIGLTINMHLFRHNAARMWLDKNPGQYEVAKRLLGHSALSQTINVYAGFEAGAATRLFADVIDAAKRA